MTSITKQRVLESLKDWKYKNWQLKACKEDGNVIRCVGWGNETRTHGHDSKNQEITVIASNDSETFKISKEMAIELVGAYSTDKELSAKLFCLA